MSVKSVPATDRSIRDKMIEEAFDLTRAIVADPTILDEIPEGAGIVLIRDDADETYVEASIAAGLEAVRQGANVYFRHLKAGEWAPSESGGSPSVAEPATPRVTGRDEE